MGRGWGVVVGGVGRWGGEYLKGSRGERVRGAYGATVARLTPDQKAGGSNPSGLTFSFSRPRSFRERGAAHREERHRIQALSETDTMTGVCYPVIPSERLPYPESEFARRLMYDCEVCVDPVFILEGESAHHTVVGLDFLQTVAAGQLQGQGLGLDGAVAVEGLDVSEQAISRTRTSWKWTSNTQDRLGALRGLQAWGEVLPQREAWGGLSRAWPGGV